MYIRGCQNRKYLKFKMHVGSKEGKMIQMRSSKNIIFKGTYFYALRKPKKYYFSYENQATLKALH